MSKHTPGPWDKWQTIAAHAATAEEMKVVLAFFYGGKPEKEEEAIANTRLIAAAPDLLEALQLILSSISGWGADTTPLDKARAAISKATGGAK